MTDSDIPRQPLTLPQLRGWQELPVPQISAAAAILVDSNTGEILYALNEHDRRAPASLVKLMTAMVALQNGRLDQKLRVRDADLMVYSVAGLKANEQLTLRDMLFILLIPSDNAASMTIARELGGNITTFVQWMNDMADGWGLQNTHFANPHGLDNKNQYMSAFDAAIIAHHAMRDPVIADIVRRPSAVLEGHWLENTNELLMTYTGTIGVKTGTEDDAGECLITMVDRPAGKVLSVVMGSTQRYIDTRLLLDYYYANFAELRVNLPPTALNEYVDADGNRHAFGLREPVTVLIHPSQVGTATYYRRIDNPTANPSADEPVGALEVMLQGRYLMEVPLYAR
ncbi:MAG: D-alanyl-D-alanine carboxypeptidase [Chloroflexi bacterium]|nr:D-alanyl-D-alanine carboxypeptidase [Chloroflexota bacterium]